MDVYWFVVYGGFMIADKKTLLFSRLILLINEYFLVVF